MSRWILIVFLVILTGVVFVGALLFFFQNSLIFHPTLLARDFKFDFPSKFTENFLPLDSGGQVNYLQFQVSQPKGVILYFHGNAGALDSWGYVASELAEQTQHEVWILDYPGYGKSTGPIPVNEKSFIAIGQKLLELIHHAHPNLPVFLFGRSLGSGLAGRLAATGDVQGLILETPYASLRSLAREIVWWVPSFLVRFDLDNGILATGKMEKILIIHGTKDRVIPYHHSQRLSTLLQKKAKFVTIPEGQHNNLSEFPLYWQELKVFLTKQELGQ
jgi:pimeloyl-ACP methyl ester carboxylesterase